MARADGSLPVFPTSGPTLDIDAAGVLLDARALVNVRNCFWQDDQTLTRRPGLWSHHLPLDDSTAALEGESPSDYAVRGLFQFDRIKSAQNVSTVYVAKVNDYLIGSRFGLNYDVPIANKLGVDSFPDFTETYVISERKNYMVICTNDNGFLPSYWDGSMPSVPEHTGPTGGSVDAGLYDLADFTYLKPLLEAGDQEFSVFHNGRLYMAGGDPYQIIYSSVDDFRDFANGGAFIANPEFGRVTGFFQTFFGELIVGQEKAISRVTFDVFSAASTLTPSGSQPITTEVGLANNRCAVQRGQDFFFLGTDGQVWSLRATQEFGDFLPATKSFPVFRKFTEGSLSARPALWAVDDVENHLAIFGISSGSGTMVDEVWAMDYARGERWTQIENKSITPFACAAVFRQPRYASRSKAVFGSYGDDTEIGKIWEWNLEHKEDLCLSTRSYDTDATTPAHLQGRARVPPAGTGASGWPGTEDTDWAIRNTSDYVNSAATTIKLTVSSNDGVVGTAEPLDIDWVDTYDDSSGTLDFGDTDYDLGDWVPIGSTNIDLKFDTGVTLTEDQELWILVDTGEKMTETYRSDLADLAEGMTHLQLDGGVDTASKNYVPVFETSALHIGDPSRDMQLEGITVITRAVGNRADESTNGTLTEALGYQQNQYRFSLDVSIKADEDREWQQIALLDGNDAKQVHMNSSLKEVVGVGLRPQTDLRWKLESTEHASSPFADSMAVNIHRITIGKKCKTYRLRFGQETMAVDEWVDGAFGGTPETGYVVDQDQDAIMAYSGDFKFVGFIPHVSPVAESPANQNEGSLSKTWEL